VNYTSREIARQSITSEISRLYQINYPEIDRARPSDVQQAGQEVANIYLRSIFPDMQVTGGRTQITLGTTTHPAASAAMMATTRAPMVNDHE
jgi:hypothetical protein